MIISIVVYLWLLGGCGMADMQCVYSFKFLS